MRRNWWIRRRYGQFDGVQASKRRTFKLLRRDRSSIEEKDWCGRRDLNPQAFWAPAPKAGVFAISPLPHGGAAQAEPDPLKSKAF